MRVFVWRVGKTGFQLGSAPSAFSIGTKSARSNWDRKARTLLARGA